MPKFRAGDVVRCTATVLDQPALVGMVGVVGEFIHGLTDTDEGRVYWVMWFADPTGEGLPMWESELELVDDVP